MKDVGDDARALDQRIAAGAQMGNGAVDLGADGGRGAGERRDLGSGDEHVADSRSRLERRGDGDDRHVRLPRRVAQGPARRRNDALRAHGSGGLECGERLLGVPRVARAEDHPLGGGPGLEAVVANGGEGQGRPAAERATREVAADRRAAHPADDQAVRLGGGDARGLDPEESVREVVGQGQDIVQLVLRIDRADVIEQRAHAATMPGSTRASCSSRTPGSIRAPSPTIAPSSTTCVLAHLDASREDRSLDPRAGSDEAVRV